MKCLFKRQYFVRLSAPPLQYIPAFQTSALKFSTINADFEDIEVEDNDGLVEEFEITRGNSYQVMTYILMYKTFLFIL
jgi:hypothetical protein